MFCGSSVSFCGGTPTLQQPNLVLSDVTYTTSITSDDFYCQPIATVNSRSIYAWITLGEFSENEENSGLANYKAKFYGRLTTVEGKPAFWLPNDAYLTNHWIDGSFRFSDNLDQKCRVWLLAYPQSTLRTDLAFGSSIEGKIQIYGNI